MKRILSALLSLAWWCLWIALISVCFWNVFSANLALQQKAKETACGGRPGCSAQLTEFMRTPIGHSYVFATSAGRVEVECRREYLLVGEYACTNGASGVVSPAPAPGSVEMSAPQPAASSTLRPAVSPKPKPAASQKPKPAASRTPQL